MRLLRLVLTLSALETGAAQVSSEPSSSPSSNPSEHPSGQPSSNPSEHPSNLPSEHPSGQPSSIPSEHPSGQPSSIPSEQPSGQPSSIPSEQPSGQPSSVPSGQPSGQPSSIPSGQPSGQPSSTPSEQPSGQPSSIPSEQPSGQPSSVPSLQPSSIPSSQPSGIPSSQPSMDPSSAPSESPSSQPSSLPSEDPSSVPSESPSSQPSSLPSEDPSSVPSERPSLQPSSLPSEHPSGIPSERPSADPSSVPSEQPSSKPSSLPSGQPSSGPSERPSSQPSSLPSGQPSSSPSGAPSSQPSSIPSERPSVYPSGEPTSLPSESPSAVPSCTPSTSPTDPATIFLFYPDWSGDGVGCNNDGNEPPYMSAKPNDYLHSTLASCCNEYFSWNIHKCMGIFPGPCARALFYPDWDGENKGCVDDGNEPAYMTDNAMYYLFSQLEDCCEEHYNWNYVECMGTPARMNTHLYYPDWEVADQTCKMGGGQPKYMNNNPSIWMHETLEACCKQNYQSTYKECVGSAPTSPSSATSPTISPGMYYPQWGSTSSGCINDNGQPPYMSNNPSNWMFETLDACCEKYYSWTYITCMSAGSSTTPVNVTGTGKYYVSWTTHPFKCVQDCVGPTPYTCGGLAQSWNLPLYDTLKACCSGSNWWNAQCDDV